jgi:hypothetical protein
MIVNLHTAAVIGGQAALGHWGTLRLTGPTEASISAVECEDVALPAEMAQDLPGATVLLNEASGRVLLLPYAAALIAGYDLAACTELFPPMQIPRHSEFGLRMAAVRLIEIGVLYISEGTLALFDDNLLQVWRWDEDFLGWTIETVDERSVRLLSGDWSGSEQRQVRSLEDGQRIG